MKNFLLGFILALFIPSILYAGTMTLVTTYPSPSGNYRNLTTTNIGIGTTNPLASLSVNGSIAINRTVVSSTFYSVAATDYYLAVNCSSAAVTVDLPSAVSVGLGRVLMVKDYTGSAAINNIILQPNGSDTIEGSSSYIMYMNNESLVLISDGNSNWEVN